MSAKGTYVLILYVKKDATLQIGKLGCFTFPCGYYAYVGSAFGPGGLVARLKHHCSISVKPHWHIDYLRSAAALVETWVSGKPDKREHAWAQQLLALETSRCPVKGFGSSDCRCRAHLVFFEHKPSPVILARALTGAVRQKVYPLS